MGLLSPHLLIKEGRSSCTAKEKDGVNELRLSSANTGRKAGWLLWQPATWLIYFRHCFLVAVTQRAGSSHVIIAGAGGGGWKAMATNAGVEPCPFCQGCRGFSRWRLRLPVMALHIAKVAFVAVLLHLNFLCQCLCFLTKGRACVCDYLKLWRGGGSAAFAVFTLPPSQT